LSTDTFLFCASIRASRDERQEAIFCCSFFSFGHTLLARQIEKNIIKGFTGYLFKSNSIRNQIKREAQGAKVLIRIFLNI
jgi:hypothetical protein